MLFIRGPIYKWYGRYIMYEVGIGVPISIILYFVVGRYVERELRNANLCILYAEEHLVVIIAFKT